MLDWIQRYQWWIVGAFVALTLVQSFRRASQHHAALPRPRHLTSRPGRRVSVDAMKRGVAVVTGASSGIGAATARRLATEGFDVVIGARRLDRLGALAAEIGAAAYHLDVTDRDSVDAFVVQVPSCRLLVNNAGGALGLDPVATGHEADWPWMFEANVLGILRMTQALLPMLEASGDGHIINMGSIAAFEPYPGGAGYNAAKAGAARPHPGAADGAARQADPHHRDRPRHGGDRVLRRALRGRRRPGGPGLRRHHAADRRRHRRLRGLGGDPAVARQHRPDRRHAREPRRRP